MKAKESSTFKTIRHIEAVRNFLNTVVKELLHRGEQHDQSKLQSPEVELFDKYSKKLRGLTYGSPEYKASLAKLKPAIDHHNANNRHHPEHYANGIKDMTLIDLLEMLCDWKASSMRQNDGNILKSIEMNQERFKYSDELKEILENTAKWLDSENTFHHTEES
jgi:hypothetical protein